MRDVLSWHITSFRLTVFEETDIFADEEKPFIFSEDSACGSFGISFGKFLYGKVCADYCRAFFIKTLVYKVSDSGSGELGRKFRAEVINYKKIAVGIFTHKEIVSGI